MLHVCRWIAFYSHLERWALEAAGAQPAVDLSYISPYDDRCGVSGAVEAVQYSMCAAVIVAFAGDYCDDFVFLLLASQTP